METMKRLLWCLVVMVLVLPQAANAWTVADVKKSTDKETVLVMVVGDTLNSLFAEKISEIGVAEMCHAGLVSAGSQEAIAQVSQSEAGTLACAEKPGCVNGWVEAVKAKRALVGTVVSNPAGAKNPLTVKLSTYSAGQKDFDQQKMFPANSVEDATARFILEVRALIGNPEPLKVVQEPASAAASTPTTTASTAPTTPLAEAKPAVDCTKSPFGEGVKTMAAGRDAAKHYYKKGKIASAKEAVFFVRDCMDGGAKDFETRRLLGKILYDEDANPDEAKPEFEAALALASTDDDRGEMKAAVDEINAFFMTVVLAPFGADIELKLDCPAIHPKKKLVLNRVVADVQARQSREKIKRLWPRLGNEGSCKIGSMTAAVAEGVEVPISFLIKEKEEGTLQLSLAAAGGYYYNASGGGEIGLGYTLPESRLSLQLGVGGLAVTEPAGETRITPSQEYYVKVGPGYRIWRSGSNRWSLDTNVAVGGTYVSANKYAGTESRPGLLISAGLGFGWHFGDQQTFSAGAEYGAVMGEKMNAGRLLALLRYTYRL